MRGDCVVSVPVAVALALALALAPPPLTPPPPSDSRPQRTRSSMRRPACARGAIASGQSDVVRIERALAGIGVARGHEHGSALEQWGGETIARPLKGHLSSKLPIARTNGHQLADATGGCNVDHERMFLAAGRRRERRSRWMTAKSLPSGRIFEWRELPQGLEARARRSIVDHLDADETRRMRLVGYERRNDHGRLAIDARDAGFRHDGSGPVHRAVITFRSASVRQLVVGENAAHLNRVEEPEVPVFGRIDEDATPRAKRQVDGGAASVELIEHRPAVVEALALADAGRRLRQRLPSKQTRNERISARLDTSRGQRLTRKANARGSITACVERETRSETQKRIGVATASQVELTVARWNDEAVHARFFDEERSRGTPDASSTARIFGPVAPLGAAICVFRRRPNGGNGRGPGRGPPRIKVELEDPSMIGLNVANVAERDVDAAVLRARRHDVNESASAERMAWIERDVPEATALGRGQVDPRKGCVERTRIEIDDHDPMAKARRRNRALRAAGCNRVVTDDGAATDDHGRRHRKRLLARRRGKRHRPRRHSGHGIDRNERVPRHENDLARAALGDRKRRSEDASRCPPRRTRIRREPANEAQRRIRNRARRNGGRRHGRVAAAKRDQRDGNRNSRAWQNPRKDVRSTCPACHPPNVDDECRRRRRNQTPACPPLRCAKPSRSGSRIPSSRGDRVVRLRRETGVQKCALERRDLGEHRGVNDEVAVCREGVIARSASPTRR